MILEVACFNIESTVIAQRAKADRIELCREYSVGGLYPGELPIEEALKAITIPMTIMIRPRAGNFVYNSAELNLMKDQITMCRDKSIAGVTFGVLDAEGNVDKQTCKLLVEIAQPMSTTFHRAFDEVKNPINALEDVIECGFARILTAGNNKTAMEGSDRILELLEFADDRIIIMPGGGIRSENIKALKAKTGASEYHSAAMNTNMLHIDEHEIRKMKAAIAE